MRRPVLQAISLAGLLLLAGCGGASATPPSAAITVLSTSPAASIVVTGDSTALAKLKAKVQTQLSAGETVVDGDQHSGTHVCGFSATKNGHSYQVDAYGGVSPNTCSTTQQQSFQTDLP